MKYFTYVLIIILFSLCSQAQGVTCLKDGNYCKGQMLILKHSADKPSFKDFVKITSVKTTDDGTGYEIQVEEAPVINLLQFRAKGLERLKRKPKDMGTYLGWIKDLDSNFAAVEAVGVLFQKGNVGEGSILVRPGALETHYGHVRVVFSDGTMIVEKVTEKYITYSSVLDDVGIPEIIHASEVKAPGCEKSVKPQWELIK